MDQRPQPGPQHGLYDPRDERDCCGFGLIAQLDDVPSATVVTRALDALVRMTHRGGLAADGLSGDGCGLLIRRPEAWLRALAGEAGIALGPMHAAGLVFLPHDDGTAATVRELFAQALREVGLAVAGWRTVPVDPAACGERARATLPRIEQVFVVPALDIDGARPSSAGFAHALYLGRRRAEQRLRARAGAARDDVHVVSLCAHAIGYKGMVLPERLAQFYPDLRRAELASSAVVFHQRFSTNSAPRWPLAQPFRLLAHNGEINTIAGNRAWARARAHVWRTPAGAEHALDPREFEPVIEMDGSDSQSLDSMLELMQAGGMDLLKALRILIPPATQSLEYRDADLAAFYDYYAINSEPWDGPAGIVVTDARFAACTLDRNGLRPARWLRTADRHFMIASEAGVFAIDEGDVEAKGKLGPGEMIAVDLQTGQLLDSEAIDAVNRARAPYKRWLKQGMTYLHSELIDPSLAAEPFDAETLARFQKLFQLTREEREGVLRPLAETEQEAIGSMGDDVPMAALSQQVRPLYDCFRQAFAQVTNPPIDPLREDCVMSLATQLGREGNLLEDGPQAVHHVMLNSPVLSQRKLRQLLAMPPFADAHAQLDLDFDPAEGLEAALRRLCAQAEQAVRGGALLLLISDRYPRRERLMVHALLATGAIHQHLIRAGLRCDANLVVETGTARDPHHFACLIGCGATAVYPYLAYQTLHELGVRGILKTGHGEVAQIGRSYRRGVKKGLLKILSKMGICTVGSYRGAQLFEIVGLDREVVQLCFTGTAARIGGAGFGALQADAAHLAAHAWNANALPDIGGLLRYVPGGEYHQFNPDVVTRLQRAAASGTREDWQAYAQAVNERPVAALRDLLDLRAAPVPVPLDEVEPVDAIVRRFDTAAMSLGALSPEAHEALAIAMNRLGGRSNSGEGGEDPARYGSERMSKIKQVASGRFGVTPHYLVNAQVLQIKIAQGAKPGEGGQLPGHKVNALIARLRHAMPGIGLISPPPHHDIYSIEDLAQLIHDLREVNPAARVSVKLVSHAGVGTIATGVVKAGADMVTISGHDGGTGASPLSSIRYAGTPWELGLAEARQALLANDLRGRVTLQADGGLKSGLDVIKAALLGAESFGFGTAPMIALGCKYLRICHLNNCATGVATQDEALRREHYTGLPERVENFFRLLAEEVREWLALLGARSVGEIVGRTDLLQHAPQDNVRARHLDLAPLLAGAGTAAALGDSTGACGTPALAPPPAGLAARLDAALADAIARQGGGVFDDVIGNTDRSIGARLSGQIARLHGDRGMQDAPITVRLRGVAGQSFGAFLAGGLHFDLTGEANDYVGKGMAGGRIVLRPSAQARYATHEAPILGNTCLYGATGGELYAAGRAGERFAVRNSGAVAVVEGAGDHCCEYMTGGVVVVLGRTGLNFGAGFTGGLAYVLDLERDFVDHYNHELIDIARIAGDGLENYRSHLRDLLQAHVEHTGSAWARRIVEEMRDFLGKFWLVKPKAASLEALAETLRRAA